MALNVQTSLANTLFSQERAASSKARADEKASANSKAKSNAFDSATSSGVTPRRFDDMVSEKKATSSRSEKTAGAPRARAPLPGQIVGHQDTVVAARDGGKSAEADAEKATKGKTDSVTARATEEAAPEKPDTVEASTADTESESVSTQAADDESPLSDEQGQQDSGQQDSGQQDSGQQDSGQQDAGQQNSDGQPQQDSERAATLETAEGDTSAAQAAPLAPVSVAAAPTAPLGSRAAAPYVGLEGQAGSVVVRVVETIGPVMDSTGNTKNVLGAVETSSIEGTSDLDLFPGMAKPVVAGAERLAEALADSKFGQEGKTGKATGDVGLDVKTNVTGLLPSAEGPTLRGSIFTQTLSDFAGLHGFERGQDLLSALDRPVAAAAQANRAADVQRPTPLQMLPIEIGMQAVRGAREFQIRLDPSELGRVDVKLHINEKGEVNASMVVERPETLQLLRRDATTLAQALEQAGLKQGENALSFSLKGENQQGQQQNNGRNASVQDGDDAALNAQIGEIAMRRVMIPNSSLDLMV